MRSKSSFVIMLAFSLFYAMDNGPSEQQRRYIGLLLRTTLDAQVRDYMNRFPDDNQVKFLNRYISVASDQFWSAQAPGKKLPKKLNQTELLSFMCKENLLKVFEAETMYDLQIRLAAMGIIYDFYRPCNTWLYILTVTQEQIKRKCQHSITRGNWPIKSLEKQTKV